MAAVAKLPPIVLIHGLSVPALVWASLPAAGRRGPPRASVRLVRTRVLGCAGGGDVTQLALLQHVGWPRTRLMGVSIGGAIAAAFVATFPDLMENEVVLVASAGLVKSSDLSRTAKVMSSPIVQALFANPLIYVCHLIALDLLLIIYLSQAYLRRLSFKPHHKHTTEDALIHELRVPRPVAPFPVRAASLSLQVGTAHSSQLKALLANSTGDVARGAGARAGRALTWAHADACGRDRRRGLCVPHGRVRGLLFRSSLLFLAALHFRSGFPRCARVVRREDAGWWARTTVLGRNMILGKVPLCHCKCRRLPLQNFKLLPHLALLPQSVTLPQSHTGIAARVAATIATRLPQPATIMFCLHLEWYSVENTLHIKYSAIPPVLLVSPASHPQRLLALSASLWPEWDPWVAREADLRDDDAAHLVKRRFGPEFDVFEVTERVWSRYNKSHARSIPAAKDTENIFLEPLQIAAARQNIAAARWLCCRRRAVLFTTGEGARLLKFKHWFLIKLIIPMLVLTGAVNKLLTPSCTSVVGSMLIGGVISDSDQFRWRSSKGNLTSGAHRRVQPIIAGAKLPLTACATAAAQLKYCRRHVTLPLCHAKIAADDFEIAADDEHEWRSMQEDCRSLRENCRCNYENCRCKHVLCV
ncbi:hypothetical protein DFH09DRAFT_1285036 [Mycena vulgaris]|nr:hypothetical protein DFH09DRAFT_1285036 [Mycena vulgaris]